MYSDGFIWFGNCGMRPVLGALILYVVLLIVTCKCKGYNISFNEQGWRLGVRKLLPCFYLFIMFILLQLPSRDTGISGETWFLNLFERYLKVEGLLVMTLAFLTGVGLTFTENANQYLDIIFKVVRCICVLSIYGNFLTGLCDYIWQNILLLFIMWGFLVFMPVFTIVAKNTGDRNAKSNYSPIEKYEDLSPDFKKIVDRLIDTIKLERSSAYSICLAGDWGIGKTSIVQGLENRLKELSSKGDQKQEDQKQTREKQSSERYEIIRINALELDTADSLFLYLFSRIKQILKKQGAYVGIGSTYRKFIGASVDTLTKSSLSVLIEGELFAQNEDYRAQKKALSDLIGREMRNGRIIIIVDDIERCEKEKIREYLFLVKEIASMERCVSIFVTDYNKLVEQIKETAEEPHIFLDKFFNYTIHVTFSVAEDVIEVMQTELNQVMNPTKVPYLKEADIKEVLKRFREKLNSAAKMRTAHEMQQNSNQGGTQNESTAEEEICHKFFIDTNNTRTILHVCKKIIQYYRLLSVCYGNDSNSATISPDQIGRYGKQIQMHDIIFFISYVECCMPLEFSSLAKDCNDYILNKKEETKEYLEVSVLAQDLLFKNENGILKRREDINTNKALDFLDTLVNQPEKLLESVDWYETKMDKAKVQVKQKQFSAINSNWAEILSGLLREQYFGFGADQSENECIVSDLIICLKDGLETQQITARNILEVMVKKHYQEFFVSRSGFMKQLENIISQHPISIPVEDKLYHQFNEFKLVYIWKWFGYYRQLIDFTEKDVPKWPDFLGRRINNDIEENISTEDILKKALEIIWKYSSIEPINDENAICALNILTEKLEHKCLRSEIYPEIAYNLSYIKCAAKEIQSLIEIENVVLSNRILQESDFPNISKCLSYFEGGSISSSSEESKFSRFLGSLKERTLKNDDEGRRTVQRLHQLVSKYVQENQTESTWHRRVVCDLEKRMEPEGEQDEHKVVYSIDYKAKKGDS